MRRWADGGWLVALRCEASRRKFVLATDDGADGSQVVVYTCKVNVVIYGDQCAESIPLVVVQMVEDGAVLRGRR